MKLRLTKKEQLLADLLEKTPTESLNIGETCKALKTTPLTLLNKTIPGLHKKLEAYASEAQVAAARKAANYGANT